MRTDQEADWAFRALARGAQPVEGLVFSRVMRLISRRRPPDRGASSLAWKEENSGRFLAKRRRRTPTLLCWCVAAALISPRVAASVEFLAVSGPGTAASLRDADAEAHSGERQSGNWLRLRGGLGADDTMQDGEAGRDGGGGGGEAARENPRRTRRCSPAPSQEDDSSCELGWAHRLRSQPGPPENAAGRPWCSGVRSEPGS